MASAGSGVTNLLTQSILFPGIFSNLMPSEANGTEAAVIISLFQMAIDPADPINMVEQVRYPTLGQTKKPLLMILGDGDSLVPNATALSTALIVDMPYVAPYTVKAPMLGARRTTDYDADGYEFSVYPLANPTTYNTGIPFLDILLSNYLGGSEAHNSTLTVEATSTLESAIRRYIVK